MVVFTAAQKQYADFVIKKIDPSNKYIKGRFYRNSCRQMYFHHVKDLNIVVKAMKGKLASVFANVADPLSRVLIIDNMAESFQLQPANGIKILDWFGTDQSDRHLFNIASFLKTIAEESPDDLRQCLSRFQRLPPQRLAYKAPPGY